MQSLASARNQICLIVASYRAIVGVFDFIKWKLRKGKGDSEAGAGLSMELLNGSDAHCYPVSSSLFWGEENAGQAS